jgi:hypothetical protein
MTSIERPTDSALGFRHSFAFAETQSRSPLFPVPDLYSQGALFRQAFRPADALSLVQLEKPDGLADNAALKLAELELALAGAAVDASLWTFRKGVQGVEFVVDAVSAATVAVARKVGSVAVGMTVAVLDNYGGSLNPLTESAYGVGNTTPAVLGIPGYEQDTVARSAFSLRLDLQTLPPSGGLAPQGLRPADVTPTNSPAYVWLPVAVPSNAVTMVFDFQVCGDGAGDRVVAGLGATNLFNLATEFVPTNTWLNSGLLPVQAWAGQETELFLGLAGGTSTNACLSVQNIRFQTTPQPELESRQLAGRTVLTWAEAVPGLQLEFSTNLTAGVWAAQTNTTAYTGQRVFTNETAATRGFWRLRRP